MELLKVKDIFSKKYFKYYLKNIHSNICLENSKKINEYINDNENKTSRIMQKNENNLESKQIYKNNTKNDIIETINSFKNTNNINYK